VVFVGVRQDRSRDRPECATHARMHAKLRLLTIVPLFAALVCASACDKQDDAKQDDAKKDAKPSLMLSNDTPACRQALECCEQMVEATKGSATPEDINLSCSGVGMAPDDSTCGEFKKGFAMAIEAGGKPLPDSCK
jgi:hypothetical protein